MASFYAELRVAGHTYPVRTCSYEFTQATGDRGRVVAKVRHGLVRLVLDVPDDDFLLDWAATPYKPLPGCVVFYETKGAAARETLSWEAGNCVGYREEFQEGSSTTGAYVCHLTIAAPKLVMQPGGPGRYVPPAPGEHSPPPQSLVNPPLLPLLTPAPVVAPLAEAVAEAAAATVLAPLAMILALILGSSTPAGGPGIPQHFPPPANRDELRLRELVAHHAAGTLTKEQEAELVALLAKVKGIHVQSLKDLNVKGPLRGDMIPLPGFYFISLNYTKRSTTDCDALRRKFNPIREKFLKDLAADSNKLARLKQAGLTDKNIERMASGRPPEGWQVHHKLPLDDGGDNSFNNLLLIEGEPYHKAITNYQNAVTSGMQSGGTRVLQWPITTGYVYP